jgi:hypothetical protein
MKTLLYWPASRSLFRRPRGHSRATRALAGVLTLVAVALWVETLQRLV